MNTPQRGLGLKDIQNVKPTSPPIGYLYSNTLLPMNTPYTQSLQNQNQNHQNQHHHQPNIPPPCPVCAQNTRYFKLPTDPSDTVFCDKCRQPCHFCHIHRRPLPGMGLIRGDPDIQKCQCKTGQSFLNQSQWNLCFNT